MKSRTRSLSLRVVTPSGACLTFSILLAALLVTTAVVPSAYAQCVAFKIQNFTGGGTVACPCFAVGEVAGVVLDAPPSHYPITILRVGVGWGSQFGGAGQSLEQGLHIYAAGLPNPGAPVFTLPGPLLTDGVINVFDLEPLPPIVIGSGPFAVGLEFLNPNAGDIFAPTVVHDGNGCQSGLNMVYAIPGGWTDACVLGVSGDWVFYVEYTDAGCPTGIGDGHIITNARDALLLQPYPNPFTVSTEMEFFLPERSHANVSVYDVEGKLVATLADGNHDAGPGRAAWDGRGADGSRMPSGVYFVRLTTPGATSTKKVLIAK